MKRWVAIAVMATSACAVQTTAMVDVSDAAAHFATDEALDESATVLANAHEPTLVESTYTTLCGGKECSGTSMQYTQAFREIASLAMALRALHDVCDVAEIGETERLVLQDAQRSLDAMRQRVEKLHATFERFDPSKDFAVDRGRRQSATLGLERARGHLDEARGLASSLETALNRRIGAAGPIELGWEEARPTEDPRTVLKRRIEADPELAPELERHGNSIDAMIRVHGMAALDHRLQAAERRQAAVQSVTTTRSLVQLELTEVVVTGPILPDVVAEWFADTRAIFSACTGAPRAFEVGLLYGADGVVSGLEVVDAEASLTDCARDGLLGTALTGTPLPSGGVVTFRVKPAAAAVRP